MQYYIILIPFLVILCAVNPHAYSNVTFLKDTIIAHPETGLFLDYVGLYRPAETIIHNSVIFPMTTALCHFLPLSAAENIQSCNITKKRNKRFIDFIVNVAIRSISFSTSLQRRKLQQQVALVQNSLSKLSQTVEIQGTQLAKLSSQQIKLIEKLQITQEALNEMLPIFDIYSAAINTLKTGFGQLHGQFKNSFLHLAIRQICRNELTLNFLSSEDIHKVVYDVIEQGNLTFNSYFGSLPVIQIITNLLVRQQIDFVPKSQYITDDPEEIGRLVITSFFAVSRQEQTPFFVFKLVTIPFFHENETIQLAQIPRYWAINPINNTTIEWHDPEESGCNLRLMTSCRDTPPIHRISKDTCIDQIIEKLPLSRCQTIQIPHAKFFVRQLRDNFWITSSADSIRCVKIPWIEYLNAMQQIWNLSEEIIFPPVSLVNVTEGYIVACPGFTLVGLPVTTNASSLVIVHNSGVLTKNISVMNVHQYITKNMTWFKNKVTERERKTLIDFLHQTNAISTPRPTLSTYMESFGVLTFNWIFFGLAALLLYYIYRRKQRNIIVNL